MIHGDLCSGIGGFALAARQLGWRTAFFAEIEPYCCKVLARHWPEVPNLGDLATIDWPSAPRCDVLTAGFPCQPVSQAGKKKGTDDERWLWPLVLRSLRALRPRWALLENTPGIFSTAGAFDDVLAGLAEIGYDARWSVLSAAEVGAPHLRERAWIIAAPSPLPDALELHVRQLRQRLGQQYPEPSAALARLDGEAPAHSSSRGRRERGPAPRARDGRHAHRHGEAAADAGGAGFLGRGESRPAGAQGDEPERCDAAAAADAHRPGRRKQRRPEPERAQFPPAEYAGQAPADAAGTGRVQRDPSKRIQESRRGAPRHAGGRRRDGQHRRDDGEGRREISAERRALDPAHAEEQPERAGLRTSSASGERRGRSRDGRGPREPGPALAEIRGADDGLSPGMDRAAASWLATIESHPWLQGEPPTGRKIPSRTSRLRALGNAIVPACAALFLEAIERADAGACAEPGNR